MPEYFIEFQNDMGHNNYHLQGVFIAEAGPSNAFDSGERSKAMDTEAARPQTERLTAQTLEHLGQGQS